MKGFLPALIASTGLVSLLPGIGAVSTTQGNDEPKRDKEKPREYYRKRNTPKHLRASYRAKDKN